MFVADGKILRVGKAFTLGDTQYPANWLRLTSDAEKAAVGITWVADPTPVDTRYYWSEGNPKRLEDEPAVDENGDPVLDAEGEQVINTGLKTQFIAEQKQIAGSLLAPTDWYITRQAETAEEVPAAVLTYRAAVRTACGAREADISGCTNVGGLKSLMEGQPKVYDAATDSMVANTAPFITPWPENVL